MAGGGRRPGGVFANPEGTLTTDDGSKCGSAGDGGTCFAFREPPEYADDVTGQDEPYVGEDRGNPEAFAHMAIDAGASLVIASGPHVLRGMQFYQGHLIAYSLGNFAGDGNFGTDGDLVLSAILHMTLSPPGSSSRACSTRSRTSARASPCPAATRSPSCPSCPSRTSAPAPRTSPPPASSRPRELAVCPAMPPLAQTTSPLILWPLGLTPEYVRAR